MNLISQSGAGDAEEATGKSKQSRNEKKARKVNMPTAHFFMQRLRNS